MIKLNLLLLFILTGCPHGLSLDPTLEKEKCALVRGNYQSIENRGSSTGVCSGAIPLTKGTMSFDPNGNYMGISSILNCTTLQKGCYIGIQCTSPLQPGGSLEFNGAITPDGNAFSGIATLTDLDVGCEQVLYEVEGTR